MEMLPSYVESNLEPEWQERVEFDAEHCTQEGVSTQPEHPDSLTPLRGDAGMGVLTLPAGSTFGMLRLFNPQPWYQIRSLPIFVTSGYCEVLWPPSSPQP